MQVGTQQRSYPHFIEAKKKYIDTGLLGKITMVRTIWNGNLAYRNLKPPDGYGNSNPPAWTGTSARAISPKSPGHPKRYFNHYVYWDYSTNAQMGGLFVHLVDVVHWYCKVERPLSASCMGGIFLGKQDRDTCDNINSILEYPNDLLVTFEANVADMTRNNNSNVDIVFMGTGGRLSIFRSRLQVPARSKENEQHRRTLRRSVTPDLHVANWLHCVRTRNKRQPSTKSPATTPPWPATSAISLTKKTAASRGKRSGLYELPTASPAWHSTRLALNRRTALADPVRALIVTGGHDLRNLLLQPSSKAYPEIKAIVDPHPKPYRRGDLRPRFDVLVLYDSMQEITDEERKNLTDFVEAGKGNRDPPPRPRRLQRLAMVVRRRRRYTLAQETEPTPSSGRSSLETRRRHRSLSRSKTTPSSTAVGKLHYQ